MALLVQVVTIGVILLVDSIPDIGNRLRFWSLSVMSVLRWGYQLVSERTSKCKS